MNKPTRRILLQEESGEARPVERANTGDRRSADRIMAAVILDDISGDRYEVEVVNGLGLVKACLAARDSRSGTVVRMNGAFKVRHFSVSGVCK